MKSTSMSLLCVYALAYLLQNVASHRGGRFPMINSGWNDFYPRFNNPGQFSFGAGFGSTLDMLNRFNSPFSNWDQFGLSSHWNQGPRTWNNMWSSNDPFTDSSTVQIPNDVNNQFSLNGVINQFPRTTGIPGTGVHTLGGVNPGTGVQNLGGAFPGTGVQNLGGAFPGTGVQTVGGAFPGTGVHTVGGAFPETGVPNVGAFPSTGVQTVGGAFPGTGVPNVGAFPSTGVQTVGGAFPGTGVQTLGGAFPGTAINNNPLLNSGAALPFWQTTAQDGSLGGVALPNVRNGNLQWLGSNRNWKK